MRAAIEHHLTYERPQRVWTAGPMFRHERPQKGRYRQFHQFDVEALGFDGSRRRRRADHPALAPVEEARAWRACRCRSTPSATRRSAARTARGWSRYFEAHVEELDEDSRRRLHTNPLRILDSKNPALQEILRRGAAGSSTNSATQSDRAGTSATCSKCSPRPGSRFEVNPRLVRGLDYYNRTVFEWVTDRLGAQGTVAGGGRYDGLFEQLGGKPTPACGFAIGVERLVLLLREASVAADAGLDAYVVHVGAAATDLALAAAERLRDAGLAIVVHAGGGSFKAQMKKADASGARFALIVGDDEAAAGRVAVKPLRAAGEQVALPPEEVAAQIRAAQLNCRNEQMPVYDLEEQETARRPQGVVGEAMASTSAPPSSPSPSSSSACRAGAGIRPSRRSRRACSTRR